MTEEGRVVDVKDKIAIVSISRSERCNGCTACRIFSDGKDEIIRLEAKNLINAGVGDKVIIEVGAKRVVTSSLLVFILPIVSLFLGYIIGVNLLPSYFGNYISKEGCGIATGFLFLFLTFLILLIIDRVISKGDDVFVISFADEKEYEQ